MLLPKAVGQEIGKACEDLPVRGCGGEASVEGGVEDQVGLGDVRDGEEGAYGIRARDRVVGAIGGGEGLRFVPDLSGEAQVSRRSGWRKMGG